MFSVNGAGFWTSGVIVVRLLFGTVSRLCVHDVATCTYLKALSELNIASNSAEVSPNKEAAHFPLKKCLLILNRALASFHYLYLLHLVPTHCSESPTFDVFHLHSTV